MCLVRVGSLSAPGVPRGCPALALARGWCWAEFHLCRENNQLLVSTGRQQARALERIKTLPTWYAAGFATQRGSAAIRKSHPPAPEQIVQNTAKCPKPSSSTARVRHAEKAIKELARGGRPRGLDRRRRDRRQRRREAGPGTPGLPTRSSSRRRRSARATRRTTTTISCLYRATFASRPSGCQHAVLGFATAF